MISTERCRGHSNELQTCKKVLQSHGFHRIPEQFQLEGTSGVLWCKLLLTKESLKESEQFAQDFTQSGLGQRLHNPSQQPAPVLSCPHGEDKPTNATCMKGENPTKHPLCCSLGLLLHS